MYKTFTKVSEQLHVSSENLRVFLIAYSLFAEPEKAPPPPKKNQDKFRIVNINIEYICC